MTSLNKPPSGQTFDWGTFKDWFFKVWKALQNFDVTTGANNNTQINGNLTVTGGIALPNGANLIGMPLSLLAASAGLDDGQAQFLPSFANKINQIIKVSVFNDAGSNTTSTSFVNVQVGSFTYTPVSTNSFLNICWWFQAAEQSLIGVNTNGSFKGVETTSGSVDVTASYSLNAPSNAGGVGIVAPASIIGVGITNSALTARSFSIFAETNNATALVGATNIRCVIQEISNV